MTARDVIHSFWVPRVRAEAGRRARDRRRTSTITPKKIGKFPVICTELCGLGHAVMRSWAVVMKPAAFKKWLAEAKKADLGGPGAGHAVFANNGCGSCHTFKPAGANGKVGPDLDKLPAYAKKAGSRSSSSSGSRSSTRTRTSHPDTPNVMPKTFASLPKAQLDAARQLPGEWR